MLVDSLTGRLNLVFHSVAVFSIQQTCKIECWLGKLDSIFHWVAGWCVLQDTALLCDRDAVTIA